MMLLLPIILCDISDKTYTCSLRRKR